MMGVLSLSNHRDWIGSRVEVNPQPRRKLDYGLVPLGERWHQRTKAHSRYRLVRRATLSTRLHSRAVGTNAQ